MAVQRIHINRLRAVAHPLKHQNTTTQRNKTPVPYVSTQPLPIGIVMSQIERQEQEWHQNVKPPSLEIEFCARFRGRGPVDTVGRWYQERVQWVQYHFNPNESKVQTAWRIGWVIFWNAAQMLS
jgi:hypothetical protein